MGHLRQDLSFAFRTLRKSPVFLGVAVLSLALGIGANTAIFTLIDQLMLRLLPVKNPKELVLLWGRGDHYGSNNGRYKISYPMYADFRDKNQVFSGMFCRYQGDMSVSFDGSTERVSGELVSGTYFPVLGVGAAIGRVFSAGDDQTPGGHPFAVLSYRYWMNRFQGDPRVIGKKLVVDGFPLTVVGVSQAGFDGLDPGSAPEIRVPIMMRAQLTPAQGDYTLTDRRGRWVNAYGRLKPGLTLERAKAGLAPLFHQMLEMEVREAAFSKAAELTKQSFLKMWIDALPASQGVTELQRRYSSSLFVLMALVGVVLLIACANLANLFIARATARQKEIAVRLALGATRMRLVSQLLVESTLLAAAGGLLGLAIAVWTDKLLLRFLPSSSSPMTISAMPDGRILLFNLAVSLAAGLLFGLAPALQATKPRIAATLKDQAGSVSSGPSVRFRKVLVTAQVTLSLLLLIAAGLFVRSLRNLKDLDPGFRTANLLTFAVSPPLNGYTPERSREFYRRLKEALDTMPGVESSSLAVVPVLAGNEWDSSMTVDTYKAAPGEDLDPHMNYISTDYFRTLSVPVSMGRDFTARDDQGAAKVAIVNEKFAQRYFPGANPVGHRVGMGSDPGTKTDIEVVGVVRNTRYETMRDEIPLEVYRPYRQNDWYNGMSVYVRTARDPEPMFRAIRGAVAQLDPSLPVSFMKTLEGQKDESMLTERLVASLSGAFGILATVLAAIGLYAVMAYMVARRTREIGIRMALGAESWDVVLLVMREVAVLVAIGIAAGLLLAWGLTGLVRTQLYGIAPNDPATVALAAAAIAVVALLAGYLPARRAVNVDPIQTLRFE